MNKGKELNKRKNKQLQKKYSEELNIQNLDYFPAYEPNQDNDYYEEINEDNFYYFEKEGYS